MDKDKYLTTGAAAAPLDTIGAQDLLRNCVDIATKLRREQLCAAVAILEKLSLENNVKASDHDEMVQAIADGKAVIVLPHCLWGKLEPDQYELLKQNCYIQLSNSKSLEDIVIVERPLSCPRIGDMTWTYYD